MTQSNLITLTAVQKFVIFFFLITILPHCTSPEKQKEEDAGYRKEISAKIYTIRDEDSLLSVLQQFIEERNDLGKMICYRQLGSSQRANARFADAINSHQEGLEIALKLKDTVEIAQALNNIGTNFRRIGAHNEA